MKCEFCKKQFDPETSPSETLCENCVSSEDELTNGKGDDDEDDE